MNLLRIITRRAFHTRRPSSTVGKVLYDQNNIVFVKNYSNTYISSTNLLDHSLIVQQRYKSISASSLFVSEEHFTLSVPVDIDLNLDNILESPDILKENLKARNISVDVEQLIKDYQWMVELRNNKSDLENELKDSAKQISELIQLIKKSSGSENENYTKSINVLKQRGNEIKQILKDTNLDYWRVKEKVIMCGLKIPNKIHLDTLSDISIIKSEGSIQNFPKSKSHVKIGREKGLIKFSNIGPKTFYLKGDLALCERELINKIQEFLKNNDLSPFSPPDIVRSVIMEGYGFDLDHDDMLTVHQIDDEVSKVRDEYHLQGTSVQSFVAYLMRRLIRHNHFPLKYFSVGRRYTLGSNLPGLFGVHQYSNTVIFGASHSEQESLRLFQEYCEIIWKFLSSFEMPVRQVAVPASKLFLSESLRNEFEIWSPSLQEYVTIGHLSCYEDFISRRLMCVHNNTEVNSMFVYMIGGEVINITRILALMLEYNSPIVTK